MAVEAESRGAEMRQHIMQAAEAIFAERGYDAASIRDISTAAGVNRALLYYYFKDKDDLFRSILADGVTYLRCIAEEAESSPGTALDKIRVFMVRFSETIVKRFDIIRVLARREHDSKLNISDTVDVLTRIIDAGIRNGEFRDLDSKKTSQFILGMVHTAVALKLKFMPEAAPEEIIDHAMTLLAEGIICRRLSPNVQ